MRPWHKLAGVLGAMLAVVGALGAAQATGAPAGVASQQHGIRTLDPRHLPSVLPRGVFRATESPTSQPALLSVNGLLNSDLAIYVSNGTAYTSLAAEGHLALHNDTGAHYVGTFVDDLGSARVFSAHAGNVDSTTLNGRYTIDTAHGTFHFVIGGTFTSTVPDQYGAGAKIGTILYAMHAYTARTPLTVNMASFTIGAFRRPVTGTLNLTTDAIGYIVPFSSRRHVNSSWVYFSHGSLQTYQINSYGRYFPPDGAGDGSLTTVLGIGSKSSVLFHIIDAKEDTGGQSIISGDALSGAGANTTQASFSAH